MTIDRDKLWEELIKYYETDNYSDELDEMMRMFPRGLIQNDRFNKYPDYIKNDMVEYADFKLSVAIAEKRFDITKDPKLYSPFSYFNMVTWGAFVFSSHKELTRKIAEKSQ